MPLQVDPGGDPAQAGLQAIAANRRHLGDEAVRRDHSMPEAVGRQESVERSPAFMPSFCNHTEHGRKAASDRR